MTTPLTDRYAAFGEDYPQQKVVPAQFARELERDLTRLTAANKALVEANSKLTLGLRLIAEKLAGSKWSDVGESVIKFRPVECFAKYVTADDFLEGVSEACDIAAQTTQDKGTM